MSIEITDDYEYHLNRMNKAFQNIQGGTYLKELTTQDKYHYAGVRKPPTFTDNGDGSVTIGDDGEYALYSDNSGSSLLEVFTLQGCSCTLQTVSSFLENWFSNTSTCTLETNSKRKSNF
jgi:hypothetical protein